MEATIETTSPPRRKSSSVVKRKQFDVSQELMAIIEGLKDSTEAMSYLETLKRGMPIINLLSELDASSGSLYAIENSGKRVNIAVSKSNIKKDTPVGELRRIQMDIGPRLLARCNELQKQFHLTFSELAIAILEITHYIKSAIDSGGYIYKEVAGRKIEVLFIL